MFTSKNVRYWKLKQNFLLYFKHASQHDKQNASITSTKNIQLGLCRNDQHNPLVYARKMSFPVNLI